MNPVMLFILTCLAAYAGARLFAWIKTPVPYMLGSMLGVAALNIILRQSLMPAEFKTLAQSISGCFIGLSLTRKDLKGLKQLLLPTGILIGCLLIFTAVMGYALSIIFNLDKATAFLVAIPGGVSEVSLMAPEFGAEPATVSFIQTFRLFTVYVVFPLMITRISSHLPEAEHNEVLDIEVEEQKETILDRIIPDNKIITQIITAVVAVIGGILGKLSGLPAGTLSFAMIFTIIFNFNCKKANLKRDYKKYAQLLSGALIGKTMTLDMVLNIKNLILPTAVLMLGYILTNLFVSYLMAKTKKIDYLSAMFASSPGGASDMALIASELGGESPKIAIMQITRLLACYTIFPLWTKLLISLFD